MADRDRSIEGALDFVGQDARYVALDSIYCTLFNLANDLDGNKEEHDIDWLAREIWLRTDSMRLSHHYDLLTEGQREDQRRVAVAALEAVEALMGRIAHRCRSHADTLGSMLKALRWEERRGERGR